MGSDSATPLTPPASPSYFNPRSPDGERHAGVAGRRHIRHDFNPRSPDGERLLTDEVWDRLAQISIHAPRMGSDHLCGQRGRCRFISIHAPRMGSDWLTGSSAPHVIVFQSTLPGWGATCSGRRSCPGRAISIHAPRMGSDRAHRHLGVDDHISIHAPRMGSDTR